MVLKPTASGTSSAPRRRAPHLPRWSSLGLRVVLWVRFGFFDASEGGLFGVGEAFGVDAEEDGDAVACPFGDLGGGDACVEPGGQAGVAEVVGAFAEG